MIILGGEDSQHPKVVKLLVLKSSLCNTSPLQSYVFYLLKFTINYGHHLLCFVLSSFKNRPNMMFDDAGGTAPDQEFELVHDVDGTVEYELKYATLHLNLFFYKSHLIYFKLFFYKSHLIYFLVKNNKV